MKKPVPFIPLRSAIIYPAPSAAALFRLPYLAFFLHKKDPAFARSFLCKKKVIMCN